MTFISRSYYSLISTYLESEVVVKSTNPATRKSFEQIAQNRQLAPQIEVKEIQVIGSSVFGEAELNPIIQPLKGRSVTLEELQEAADKISQLYVEKGFLNSRAFFLEESRPTGVVEIQVFEGGFEHIIIEGTERMEGYVRSYLESAVGKPANLIKLENQLRLLRANPLFENIEASLRPGEERGTTLLVVRVTESRRNTRKVSDRVKAPICLQPTRIFVSFVPTSVQRSNQDFFACSERTLTSDFESFLNVPQRKAPLSLSFPQKAEDKLEILIISSEGDAKRIRVPNVTRDEVFKQAKLMYNEISSESSDYLEPASKMYRWLIAPIEAELQAQEIENLVFVMPPGLRPVALAALYDHRTGEYLIQKYTVGLMSSLNLGDTCYTNMQNMQVLAMGASKFRSDQDQVEIPLVTVELLNNHL